MKFRCSACAATVPAGTMYCPKCDKVNPAAGTYVRKPFRLRKFVALAALGTLSFVAGLVWTAGRGRH